jgi:hypothetical protein
MVIILQAGSPSCFQLDVAVSQLEQTFSVIKSAIFVQVMDSGRNVRLIIELYLNVRIIETHYLRSLSMEASIILSCRQTLPLHPFLPHPASKLSSTHPANLVVEFPHFL